MVIIRLLGFPIIYGDEPDAVFDGAENASAGRLESVFSGIDDIRVGPDESGAPADVPGGDLHLGKIKIVGLAHDDVIRVFLRQFEPRIPQFAQEPGAADGVYPRPGPLLAQEQGGGHRRRDEVRFVQAMDAPGFELALQGLGRVAGIIRQKQEGDAPAPEGFNEFVGTGNQGPAPIYHPVHVGNYALHYAISIARGASAIKTNLPGNFVTPAFLCTFVTVIRGGKPCRTCLFTPCTPGY
jgi:hypothetical protein